MVQLSPDGAKTLGQSINKALTYGLGLMAGFFISGFLYERAGAPFTFMVSALLAFLGGVVFLTFRWLVRGHAATPSRDIAKKA